MLGAVFVFSDWARSSVHASLLLHTERLSLVYPLVFQLSSSSLILFFANVDVSVRRSAKKGSSGGPATVNALTTG